MPLAQGMPVDAAQLLGAVQALLAETADQLTAADRELIDDVRLRARARLGSAFDTAFSDGLQRARFSYSPIVIQRKPLCES